MRAAALVVDAQRRVYVVGSADLVDPNQGPRQVFGRRFREDGVSDTSYENIFYGHEFDATGRDDLDATLREAAAAGATVMVASHELERAGALASRVVDVVGGLVRPAGGAA